MHPHLHPSSEKIEKMYLVKGSFGLLIFDDDGKVTDTIILEKELNTFLEVPAFTWHTYVMLTKEVVVYETMEGVYDQATWKEMAPWAPAENTTEAVPFLEKLKTKTNIRFKTIIICFIMTCLIRKSIGIMFMWRKTRPSSLPYCI